MAAPLHCSASAQAQRHSEAAKLLVDAAEQLASRQAPPLQIKKLYVLAALEVEAFKKKTMSAGEGGAAVAEAAQSGRAAGSSVLTGGKKGAGAANTLAGAGTDLCSETALRRGLQRVLVQLHTASTHMLRGRRSVIELESLPAKCAQNLQPPNAASMIARRQGTSNEFPVR
jgi:hypothetical protein